MSALRDRIAKAQPCLSVSASGDRCTRTDLHGPEDTHRRGAATWGYRDLPPGPRWLANLKARELSGYGEPVL